MKFSVFFLAVAVPFLSMAEELDEVFSEESEHVELGAISADNDEDPENAIENTADELIPAQPKIVKKPVRKKWSAAFKPGYFFFMDNSMQNFFNNGGFTFRAEANYNLWGPILLWMDGGYFQKEGKALGGTEKIDFKLATLTLGFKLIHYFCDQIAVYAGAGPRLFMMMMDNESPFVSGEDNEIGIGGGFDAGFWFFPFSRFPNVYFDLFADYSWKTLVIDPDEVSSIDNDVDVSSITGGLGLGVRF